MLVNVVGGSSSSEKSISQRAKFFLMEKMVGNFIKNGKYIKRL